MNSRSWKLINVRKKYVNRMLKEIHEMNLNTFANIPNLELYNDIFVQQHFIVLTSPYSFSYGYEEKKWKQAESRIMEIRRRGAIASFRFPRERLEKKGIR